ncbi:MAG: fatty acid desaturase [Myxococcales bacterium]|nr:fatty acid desaturase [Myxococcales bacterium]
MISFTDLLKVQPSVQFRRTWWFYLAYDAFWFVVCAAIIAICRIRDFEGIFPGFALELWLLLPLVAYLHIAATMTIHNCSHGNLPRSINRLVGEFLGLIVLSRYASWEIVHRRHHKYSDDPEKDPHPIVPNYWKYLCLSITNVEHQLQTQFLEWHGDTPSNRRFEKIRAIASFGTNFLLIGAWYHVLGAGAFWILFVPANILGILHVVHFNWVTHNGHRSEVEPAPVNLDHGLYWIGNRILFGIYYHKNHHSHAGLFNPMHLGRRKQSRRA